MTQFLHAHIIYSRIFHWPITQFFTFLRFITHWIFNVLLTDLFWGKTQREEQTSFYYRGFFGPTRIFQTGKKCSTFPLILSGSKNLESLSTNVSESWTSTAKSMFLLLFVFNSNCNQWVEKLLFSIRDLAFFNLKSIIRHKKENIWLPGLRRSGFTRPLRYQRVEEHKNSSSSIAKYFREKHCLTPKDLEKNFKSKFDCLVYDVFFYWQTETKSHCTIWLHSCKSF